MLRLSVLLAAALAFAAPAKSETAPRIECALPVGANCAVQDIIASAWDASTGEVVEIRRNQTLTKSAILVAAGRLKAAPMTPATYMQMVAGEGVYAAAPEKSRAAAANLRSLFGFVDGYTHIIADASTTGDLRETIQGRKVFVGPPSGSTVAVAGAMLKAGTGGLEMGADYEPVTLGWGSGLEAFAAGKVDVYIRPMPTGLPLIARLSQYRNLRLVGLTDEEVARMEASGALNFPGVSLGAIPAGVYPELANGDQPHRMIAYTLAQVVGVSLDDDAAYAMTKAFWDGLTAAKAANPALAQIDPNRPFAGLNIPLHPGAARYYREVGVTPPPSLLPPG